NKTEAATRERSLGQALVPVDAIDYFLLGAECLQRKELLPASAHFKNVLRIQPDSFWAQYYLTICSLQLQRPDQAETSLMVCQGLRQDFVWVYILRGFVRGQLGERALLSKDVGPRTGA